MRQDTFNMPERSALDEHIRSLRIVIEAFEKMRQVGDFYVGGTRFAVSAHPNSHFDERDADDMRPSERPAWQPAESSAEFRARAEAHLGGPVRIQIWGDPDHGVPFHRFATKLDTPFLEPLQMRMLTMGWQRGGAYCEPVACTAHVDPLVQQQAQTAAQAQASNSSLPCASCGSWLKPNNGVTVAGKLYHAGCDPRGSSAAQPAPLPPWGEWFASPDEQAKITGDFGATVSDALAQQRGIDKAAANERMRVPSWEEKEATRKADAARIAEIMRDYR